MDLTKIAKWIYNKLGDDFGGTPSPPGSTQWLYFGEFDKEEGAKPYVAHTGCNDGFEVWLGTHHEWHVFYRAKDARKLAWFILWEWWAKSTWFGLKRKIWYKALLH